MKQNLLVFNDLASYGKVASSVMIPIFSHYSIETFVLPTALVSNTLDYGKFEILDTTSYIKNTLEIWDQLNFKFSAISIGFIVSLMEAELINDYILKHKELKIYVDPIMGDDGKLYNGISKERVECMKILIKNADLIMPNLTEACYLTDTCIGKVEINEQELKLIIDKLSLATKGDIIITSVKMGKKAYTVIKKNNKNNFEYLEYNEIPVRFPGTGDIFSSIVISNLMSLHDLKEATLLAMKSVRNLIEINKNNQDKFKGIPIELYLGDIINE